MTNFKWIIGVALLLVCGQVAAETLSINPDELFQKLTNPNTAYLLLIVGIYGVLTELSHPGLVLPGLIGVIALTLAGYAMTFLPVNYVGLGLLIFGIVCMLSEIHITSYGVLGITGLVGFIVGSSMLYQSDDPNLQLSKLVIAITSLITLAFFLLIFRIVVRAHQRPVVTGKEALLNSTGTVFSAKGDTILVLITGEVWQARSKNVLSKGQRVKVINANGLFLEVEPTDK